MWLAPSGSEAQDQFLMPQGHHHRRVVAQRARVCPQAVLRRRDASGPKPGYRFGSWPTSIVAEPPPSTEAYSQRKTAFACPCSRRNRGSGAPLGLLHVSAWLHCWAPDLPTCARQATASLAPGGRPTPPPTRMKPGAAARCRSRHAGPCRHGERQHSPTGQLQIALSSRTESNPRQASIQTSV